MPNYISSGTPEKAKKEQRNPGQRIVDPENQIKVDNYVFLSYGNKIKYPAKVLEIDLTSKEVHLKLFSWPDKNKENDSFKEMPTAATVYWYPVGDIVSLLEAPRIVKVTEKRQLYYFDELMDFF